MFEHGGGAETIGIGIGGAESSRKIIRFLETTEFECKKGKRCPVIGGRYELENRDKSIRGMEGSEGKRRENKGIFEERKHRYSRERKNKDSLNISSRIM